jgi:hypothetical protein
MEREIEFIAALPQGSPPAATHSEVNCDSNMNIARTKLAAGITSACGSYRHAADLADVTVQAGEVDKDGGW